MDKKISDIYYNNIYGFANEQNVFYLQEKNKGITVNDRPMFSFMMCVYNDMSLFNSFMFLFFNPLEALLAIQ